MVAIETVAIVPLHRHNGLNHRKDFVRLDIADEALTASGASAAVVCNDEGDCWKVKDKYEYPPEVRLHAYDDDWKWEGDKYRWRDPGAGRGYYRGGAWIGF